MKERYLILQQKTPDWGWKELRALYLHNLDFEKSVTLKNELIEQHNKLQDQVGRSNVRIIYRTEEEVTWGL